MANTIQLRRDTAANWTANNPILADGEIGIELDTRKLKIGSGAATWNTLPYYTTEGTGIQDIIAGLNVTIDKTDPTMPIINSQSGGTPEETNPVENEYDLQADMLADQANQNEGFFQYVLDDDGAGNDAYYEKLATSTGAITDYRELSDEEILVVTDSNGFKVFRVSDLQDDSAPLTSVSGGRIGIEYNTTSGKITGLFFNKAYTKIIANVVALNSGYDYVVNIYNRALRKYELINVLGFTTVNTNYTRATVEATVDISVFEINNRIEVDFDIDTASGSGASNPPTVGAGTELDLSNYNGIYYSMNSADSNIVYTLTGEVLGGVAFKLINCISEPIVDGAIKIEKGNLFVGQQNIYLVCRYNGVVAEYWFESINSDLSAYTGLPYGVVVAESSNPNTIFLGTPAVLKITSSSILMTHDYYGASDFNTTSVYINDKLSAGQNFNKVADVTPMFWATPFEYNGDLFLFGVDQPIAKGGQGNLALSKSTDGGYTWSTPIIVLNAPSVTVEYLTSASSIIIKDGYLVVGIGERETSISLGFGNVSCGFALALLADIENPSNWSVSNFVAFDAASFELTRIWSDANANKTPVQPSGGSGTLSKGFLEPCIIQLGNGDLRIFCRLEQTKNSNHGVYLDVLWNNTTPTNSTLSSVFAFNNMGGGNIKYRVLKDPLNNTLWAVTNLNRYRYFTDNRLENYLVSSIDDGATWRQHGKVAGFTATIDWEAEIYQLANQYPYFIIDGNDIWIAGRTSDSNALAFHDANLLTLTLFEKFRDSPIETFENGSLVIDENSERLEDVNGIALIKDQTKYYNSGFMRNIDNSAKPIWDNGIVFDGASYLRIPYHESLKPINNGFTILFVIEDLQDVIGNRLLSFSKAGSNDLNTDAYFYSAITGLCTNKAFGSYSDTVVGTNYILAASYDPSNRGIYNYLNGANRGVPDSVNFGVWDTDKIIADVPFVPTNYNEIILGGRVDNLGAGLLITCKLKAILILQEYKTPAEIATLSASYNTRYPTY